VRAGRLEHATHEPLTSRAMLAEVPLAGLSLPNPFSGNGLSPGHAWTWMGKCQMGDFSADLTFFRP
jgi:hypothetical protein